MAAGSAASQAMCAMPSQRIMCWQVARMEQMETAAEAKAKRGPKATIRRQLTRVHTPATSIGTPSASCITRSFGKLSWCLVPLYSSGKT